MNPSEVLRIVDAIHRDKNIDKEIVVPGDRSRRWSRRHERTTAKKRRSRSRSIGTDGSIQGDCDGEPLDPEETVGRIGAQTAKQVIIQKIREAERDALYDEYDELIGPNGRRRRPAKRGREPPPFRWETSRRFCPAVSRFQAKRITPTSGCGRPSSMCERREVA